MIVPIRLSGRRIAKQKVKRSTDIDQQDESEVLTVSRSHFDSYFQNHIDTAVAESLEDAPSSPEQIAAVERKLSTGTKNHMQTLLFSPHSDEECNG